MSTADDEPEDLPAEQEPPHPDSIRWLFFDPGVRNYVFTGLGALAMVFAILLAIGGPLGGLLVVLIGVAGLLFRWPAAPPLFLLLLLWFVIFPGGIPPGYESPWEITEGRFRVPDLILVFSAVVYLACHYRLYGLSTQALPFDGPFRRKGEKPYRRPPGVILPGEIGRLLGVVGAVVIAGQLAWLFVTSFEAAPGEFIPLKPIEDRSFYRRNASPGTYATGVSRFMILTGLIFFTTLFARLVFGYWRLRLMGPAEAGMVLQDAGWDETRREQVRIETWLTWRRKRNAEKAEEEARKAAKKNKAGGDGRRGADR
ncbi:MAG TPA: hypothetical protein VKE74_35265 [Gemmataceae bacterium]|nr:hypothetical protein [Gemmataceae bacterium]